MDSITEVLPDWLRTADTPLPKFPSTKEHRELREVVFDSIFERVLEALEAGEPASRTIKSDPRQIDVGQFMAWVRRDTERFQKFQEAKQNGMLILEDKLIEIAEGAESTEDVQRSKLRADTIKWVMQSWDKRYKSDSKNDSNQFGGVINITISDVDSPYLKRESLILDQK